MRNFQRSVNSLVVFPFLVIALVLTLALLPMSADSPALFASTPLFANMLCWIGFFIVAGVVAANVIPPDFKYYIRTSSDYLIFEFSEDDHRKLNKSFATAKQRHHIILDDGFSRIRIAYNKEVLRFLNEIKN